MIMARKFKMTRATRGFGGLHGARVSRHDRLAKGCMKKAVAAQTNSGAKRAGIPNSFVLRSCMRSAFKKPR